MSEKSTFATLTGYLGSAIERFPDQRTGSNCVYSIRDAALSAFSTFFLQWPSFLSFQRTLDQTRGENNARTLFGVEKIPTDNCIRTLLDPVPPALCYPVFSAVHATLSEQGAFESAYRSVLDTYLLALDGTWFFHSGRIHCDACSVATHRDGSRSYYHSALTPVFVRGGSTRVICAEPEFISPQDGEVKQDCEINAAKRWISGVGARYAPLGVTLLGDDLFAHQPFCQEVLEAGFHFLFTCKSSSHKYLYQWIEEAEVGPDIEEVVHKRWTGKERLIERYRFINDVPLREGADAIRVNWCELQITDSQGKVRHRFAFITDHRVTRETVVSLVAAGRARWKIENEHNNTLKTKGYNLEHNFGHGAVHLSNLMLTMNLLAFLFHTVLDLFDRRYASLRQALGRRDTLFHDMQALLRYLCFPSWTELLRFMIAGLEIPDPGG